MKNKKFFITIAVLLLLIILSVFRMNPFLRAKSFVFVNGQKIEDALHAGYGIPGRLGEMTFNTWEGNSGHSMLEFVLITRGDSYYGCYYSPDDVPLAFQNTDAELVQCGHDSWRWKAEGDNHGKTRKINNHWYYFEASF